MLNGKRKCKLQAFFRFMLSKVSASPAPAWMRIQGSTFFIYDVGYFNPICRGLQSHAANKVYTPRRGRFDANRGNEGAGFFDGDACRPTRTHLRGIFSFKE